MDSEKRAELIRKTCQLEKCQQLGMHPARDQKPCIDVEDKTGDTYYFRSREVEGEGCSTAFDFHTRKELDAPYHFLLGVLHNKSEIIEAFRVRRGDLNDMVNVNESKFCLRWNNHNRKDSKIEYLHQDRSEPSEDREEGLTGPCAGRGRATAQKPGAVVDEQSAHDAPERRASTILRVIRDTEQARKVKELYDYRCQVCRVRLETAAGPYAEAAHIRPLGEPDCGPDSQDNMLCLCPNHHVLFDLGAFSIADDLSLIGRDGKLTTQRGHNIRKEFLLYHREHILNMPNQK